MDFLGELLRKWQSSEIFLRGEETNIWCLLSAIVRPSFYLDDPMRCYAEQFLKFQKPKIVVTTIDDSVVFYQLKQRFPDVQFISVQDGNRDLGSEFFLKISRVSGLQCDYFFCAGSGIGEIYKRHIQCSVVCHGSIRNNMVERPMTRRSEDTIAFVSEWEPSVLDGERFVSYPNGRNVAWGEFFKPDTDLLPLFVDYCVRNLRKLVIVGRQRNEFSSDLERAYFAERISGCSWSFEAPTKFSSSYVVVDHARIILGVGSTLLVEALARGCRVAIFNARKFLDFNHRPFIFDEPNAVRGSFWTDEVTLSEFARLVNYLDSISDGEWESERIKYTDRVMNFDMGNFQLVNTFSRMLLESNGLRVNS
jgi:surface carbohydrate biosynthesis protein